MSHSKSLTWGAAVLLASLCMFSQSTYAQTQCALPQALIKNDPVQTSWAIFVAAMCPSGSPQKPLSFENWVKQSQEHPGAGLAALGRTLVPGGQLASFAVSAAKKNEAATRAFPKKDCRPGQANGNVVYCEEVYTSPAAKQYSNTPVKPLNKAIDKLGALQAKLASAQPRLPFLPGFGNIQFPASGVEIKADWIQYQGACPEGLRGVWTETVNGNCVALAAIHVVSKLEPNWIGATFEPQNTLSNPNRCMVLGCRDPFGSNPAETPKGKAGFTSKITAQLQSMMAAANLSEIFQNYRLNGVQTTSF